MEKIPNPTIELYASNHTLDFPGFQGDDAAVVSRMWDEWYDSLRKDAKEHIKRKHKAEIADAASQYEL